MADSQFTVAFAVLSEISHQRSSASRDLQGSLKLKRFGLDFQTICGEGSGLKWQSSQFTIQLTMGFRVIHGQFFFTMLVATFLVASAAAPQPTATIDKPKTRTVTGGFCRILSNNTFSGNFGPNSSLPTLALTIGPGSTMADALHANKANFTGPGMYKNEIIAVYLGKTALEDSYMGLGTVVINADKHSGTFSLNDKSAAGHFDCGAPPAA
jgi:hypothetical protein